LFASGCSRGQSWIVEGGSCNVEDVTRLFELEAEIVLEAEPARSLGPAYPTLSAIIELCRVSCAAEYKPAPSAVPVVAELKAMVLFERVRGAHEATPPKPKVPTLSEIVLFCMSAEIPESK
jgi:hypothetical protein